MFEDKLRTILNDLGVAGIDTSIKQLYKYSQLVFDWNKKAALVSSKDTKLILERHILESVITAYFWNINGTMKIMEMGAGAGFPGYPIKICFPEINITFVESIKKKTLFLEKAKRELGLKGVEVECCRLEDLANNDQHNGQYDLVSARALASLDKLLGYAKPFLKTGVENAKCVFPKGTRLVEEIKLTDRDKWQINIEDFDKHVPSDILMTELKTVTCTFTKGLKE